MWTKALKVFDDVEEWFLIVSIVLNVLLVFVQVVMRYVFRNSLSWSEELARYMFAWYSWVGTSYAVRYKGHLRVEILANLLKGKIRGWFEVFVLGVWLVFSFFLAYQGYVVTRFVMENQQLSAAMEIPMAWAYASVPVGCFLMGLRLCGEIWKTLKGLRAEEGMA